MGIDFASFGVLLIASAAYLACIFIVNASKKKR
ncbi:hypothetical protein TALC_01068 [Thermoplasmatales archaeon BRNA1]|nr:hypothetical protein TALC_01068 [Thermoplasmatales archaeon BRNA1]